MGVNVEMEHKRRKAQVEGFPSTVREKIDDELEAIQKSSEGQHIYEIHRSFESLKPHKKNSRLLVDGLLGVWAFIVFLIVYPFVALGIKLSSKGPVLYKQRRTGKDGKEFTCFKFRTMHQIDLRRIDGKPTITTKGDKRIFSFGQILRRTSLDELPQIINVLKGDMSLVGPRPYPIKECSYWNSTFDDFYYRYAAKPGITGLAQINGYRGGTLNEQHMRKRLDYDLIYVKKASLKLNMYIITKTFRKIVDPDPTAH